VRLLDFLKPAVPQIAVGPEDSDRVHQRVQEMVASEEPALVLREVVETDLFDASTAYRAALGVSDGELACELYIQAFIGFLRAADEEGMDLDTATDRLEPHHAALREYVAFAHRERFDDGPIGTWQLSRKMAGERDPSHVALGMASVRLGVGGRRGAVEGLMRLGLLAQAAGYGLGKVACR
jgi:hypothetical protein